MQPSALPTFPPKPGVLPSASHLGSKERSDVLIYLIATDIPCGWMDKVNIFTVKLSHKAPVRKVLSFGVVEDL